MNKDKALKIIAEAFDKAVKEFGEKKLVESIRKQGGIMEIKVGQKWRTRDGNVVQTVEDDGSEPRFKGSNGNWYYEDGVTWLPNLDLTELIQDEKQSTAESLRSRILEIDKERAVLVKQLAELGFSIRENHEPRDWQKGDVVECVKDLHFFTEGNMYVIECGEDKYGDVIIQEDDEGDECWVPSYCFKFHHRP